MEATAINPSLLTRGSSDPIISLFIGPTLVFPLQVQQGSAQDNLSGGKN